MSKELSKWTDDVWGVLAEFPGAPEVVSDQRCRWDDLRASDELRVVIYGAYDAGKSTLLKRLLIEAGTGVPEWLTISARRETFDTKEIPSGGIVFVDTPGLGSGNDDHDQLTLDALKLADAYLWVLPPQLVTSHKEIFVDFLSGRYFSDSLPASVVAGSTVAVVAQMEEAGIDPADNLDGFRELVQRKVAELELMLRNDGIKAKLHAICCVVADPYQNGQNNPNPDREIYDVGREWDGVKELAESLEALRSDRETLRDGAGARFVSALARVARDELKDKVTELRLSLEGCVAEIDRHRLYEQRLNALRTKAEADLHRFVEEELLCASRANSESGADTTRNLENSLSGVVDEWSEICFADYRRLVKDVEFEIRERMASPSLVGFRRLAKEAEEGDAMHQNPVVDSVEISKRILSFGPALRGAFDKYANSELGMSLKTAAERLEKIESSGETVEAFIKSQGRKAMFRGSNHADKASRLVKWGRVIDEVGPLVEQLGGALLEVADEVMTAQRAEEMAQQRQKLREKLRLEAQKLEREAIGDFKVHCDGLRKWLQDRVASFDKGKSELDGRIQEFLDFAGRIDEVLQEFPERASPANRG